MFTIGSDGQQGPARASERSKVRIMSCFSEIPQDGTKCNESIAVLRPASLV